MIPSVLQFRKIVEPWLGSYDRIVVSAIGIKAREERNLLLARILLASTTFNERSNVLPLDNGAFWGVLKVEPWCADDFEGMLGDAINGVISIDSEKVMIPIDGNQSVYPVFYSGHHPGYGISQSMPRLPTLVIRGGSRNNLINKVLDGEEINWHLRALSPPFFDFADLHTHFRLPPPEQVSDQSQIEIMVMSPITIDNRSIISGGTAKIYLSASNLIDQEHVTLGYRSFANADGSVREKISAKSFKWEKKAGALEGVVNIDVGNLPAVQCFLTYAGIAVHQLWVFDPAKHLNARYAIHSAFDPGQELLMRLLVDPKPSDARSFEDGAAVLLSMLGFSIVQEGRNQKLSNAPDILAFTPGGNVAVIECTVGLPNEGDQVAKILRRTETIRSTLMQCGWPNVQLLPLIVTSLPAAVIAQGKSAAEQEGIFVICREDIITALERVRYPSNADEFFNAAVAHLKRPQFLRG